MLFRRGSKAPSTSPSSNNATTTSGIVPTDISTQQSPPPSATATNPNNNASSTYVVSELDSAAAVKPSATVKSNPNSGKLTMEMTDEEFNAKTISELRSLLASFNLSTHGLLEKTDLKASLLQSGHIIIISNKDNSAINNRSRNNSLPSSSNTLSNNAFPVTSSAPPSTKAAGTVAGGRRESVKPDGLQLPPIGIHSVHSPILDEEEDKDGHRRESPPVTTKDLATNPQVVCDRINRLSEVFQELSVNNRDNNAILYQMLFMMEERMNRRIDCLKEELLTVIDNKFNDLQHQIHHIHRADVEGRGGIGGIGRMKSRQSSFGLQNQQNGSVKHFNPSGSLSGIFEDASASSVASTAEGDGGGHNNRMPGQSLVLKQSSLSIGGSAKTVPPGSSGVGGGSVVAAGGAGNLRRTSSGDNNSQGTYETRIIHPIPGFVIKTRKLIGDKEKIFINVFHNEIIELVPSNLPKTITGAPDGKPYLVMGDVTHSLDSHGHNCYTYNIGVSSDYFKAENAVLLDDGFKISAPSSIQKIIHKVNLKHNEFFDENSYSLPRLANGYKGDELSTLQVPVLVPRNQKLPESSPATVTAGGSSFRGGGGGRGGSFPTTTAPSSSERSNIQAARNNSFGGNESIISELTSDNQSVTGIRRSPSGGRDSNGNLIPANSSSSNNGTGLKKKMTRKSIFDPTALAFNAGNIAGRNLLSGDMCDYVKEESIEGGAAEQLKEASANDPYLLLGWQISLIMESGETEIFVVTGVRKNLLNQTEYRLSRFHLDDSWIRLKRSEGKTGQDFRPLRKVLFGLTREDDYK